MTQYIAYYRVSTQKQGRSGLGLEAQQEIIKQHVASAGGKIIAEFTEVESGKRAKNRPKLQEALKMAGKRSNPATLIVAKLDRLARQASFVTTLLDSRVEFVACDFPSANRFVLQVMAAVAEYEAKLISDRTKAALAARAARGLPLGNPQLLGPSPVVDALKAKARAEAERLRPIIDSIRASGVQSVRGVCDELNERGYTTPSGNAWHPTTVARLFRRLYAAREVACLA